MLKIRLRRMGAKKAPFYRIVVADFPRTPRRRFCRRNRLLQPPFESHRTDP